jgi:hypothetical protein
MAWSVSWSSLMATTGEPAAALRSSASPVSIAVRSSFNVRYRTSTTASLHYEGP